MPLQQSSSGHEANRFAFSPEEAARLEIYRNAVRAGFYNDDLGCDDSAEAQLKG